jgi:hypothetical protein
MWIRVDEDSPPKALAPVKPDHTKFGYLETLAGEAGVFMRLYALGGTCLLVFLLALALFSV